VITDGQGQEAIAVLGRNGSYSAREWQTPGREPRLQAVVFAAVSKGERFEWLIEKAVEMGVVKIVPLLTERCIVKGPGATKVERWRKIAATAMIQCGGCLLPEVAEPTQLEDLPAPAADTTPILLHEEALSVSLHELPVQPGRSSIWLASGPEGGFSDREVNLLLDKGWQPVWLGRRLFKTDTAPTIALANLLLRSWFG
jgi:16S rRNA (uracil1498-N3)-methyltransferase